MQDMQKQDLRLYQKMRNEVENDVYMEFIPGIQGEEVSPENRKLAIDAYRKSLSNEERIIIDDKIFQQLNEKMNAQKANLTPHNEYRSVCDTITICHEQSPELDQAMYGSNKAKTDYEKSQRALEYTQPSTELTGGGIEYCGHFSGAYSKAELTTYLNSLAEKANNPLLQNPISLFLRSGNHAITLGYDAKDEKWYVAQANSLPIREYPHPSTIVADEIIKACSLGKSHDKAIFSTTLYASKNDKPAFQNRVKNLWNENQEWKDMHKVTTEKAQWKDPNNFSWLYVAQKTGDYKATKALVAEKSVIQYMQAMRPDKKIGFYLTLSFCDIRTWNVVLFS